MTASANWFTLFVEGDELYDAMLVDLAVARRTIRLESYIFADDEVGARFVEALCRSASAGVECTLRLDAAGSMGGLHARSLALLRDAGVLLEWSRAWSWRSPGIFHLRNHRKLLVVDDEVAYLGGFNIHRDSSRRAVGDVRWRDTHVRITGDVVQDAAAAFDLPWGPEGAWKRARRSPAFLLPNRTAKCRHRLRCAYLEGSCACSPPPICSGVARPPAPPSEYAWRCEPRPPPIRSDGCPGVQPRMGTICHGKHSCGYGRCGGVVIFCDHGHWQFERAIPPPP